MRHLLTYFIAICCLLCTKEFAQISTTQPAATQPTIAASIQNAFRHLSDPDPKTRDQAKMDLMGLSAQDLPKLRQTAADNVPLSPDVTAALHDVVVQVFLADAKYTDLSGAECNASGSNSPYFFLGIRWSTDFDNANARLGAEIDERLPGFPGFRFLRKGDMVLGVSFDSTLPMMETHTRTILVETIQQHPQRQNIVLQIMRDGEVITVPIKMAPRPMDSGPPAGAQQNLPPLNLRDSMNQFGLTRSQNADDYWHLNFDAIVEDHLTTATSNPVE